MTTRRIAIGETAAAQGRILLHVLNSDGSPCIDLAIGHLWIARNGDATYTAAGGTLTAITLDGSNVGTYRYALSATEKAVLGQGLIAVKKTGVLYQPTEFLIAAASSVADEPQIGPPALVQSGTNTTTQVTLSDDSPAALGEYAGAEIRFLAGTNAGLVRTILEAETISSKTVVTLDSALPAACDTTTRYIIIARWVRGVTPADVAKVANPFRAGVAPSAGILFELRDTAGALATGKTVAIRRRLNNGAYASATNAAATELSDGQYKWTPTDAEWAEGQLTMEATALGCQPTTMQFFILPAE